MLEKHIRNGIIRYNQEVCISQNLNFQTIEIEITLILLKNKTFCSFTTTISSIPLFTICQECSLLIYSEKFFNRSVGERIKLGEGKKFVSFAMLLGHFYKSFPNVKRTSLGVTPPSHIG
jgi:hypothetical protein